MIIDFNNLSPTISNVGEQLRFLCARTSGNKPHRILRRGQNVTMPLFANAVLLTFCSSHLVALYQWPLSFHSPRNTNPISNRSKSQAAQRN